MFHAAVTEGIDPGRASSQTGLNLGAEYAQCSWWRTVSQFAQLRGFAVQFYV